MSTARPDLGEQIYNWHGLSWHKNGPAYVLPSMRDADRFNDAASGRAAVTFLTTTPSAEALETFRGINVAVVVGHSGQDSEYANGIVRQVHRYGGTARIVRTAEMEFTVGQQVATPAGVLDMRRAAHKQFGLSDPETMDPIWRKQAGYKPPGANGAGNTTTGTGGGKPPEATGELVFESFADVKCKPIKWLVPTIIPAEKSLLIAADGGKGKSTLSRHLAARVSSGRPAFGMTYDPGKPGTVIMLAPEDGPEDTVVPHLIAEGADLSRVGRIITDRPDKDGRSNKVLVGLEHIVELDAMIRKRGDVRLIIVDPIISIMSRAGINDAKAAEVRKVMDPLSALAESTGAAVIVVCHVNKSQTEKAVDRIAGSKQYSNAVRLAYTIDVDPDDDDRRLLLKVKGNLRGIAKALPCFSESLITEADRVTLRNHPNIRHLPANDIAELTKDLGRLEFHEPREASADEVMNAGSNGGNRTTRVAEAAGWVAEFFKADTSGYAWPDEEMEALCIAAGFDAANFRRAKTKLRAAGTFASKPKGEGGKWYNWFGPKGSTMPAVRPEALIVDFPAHPEQTAHSAKTAHGEHTDNPPNTPPNQSEQSEQSHQSEQCEQSEQVHKSAKLDEIEAHNRAVDVRRNSPKSKSAKGRMTTPEFPGVAI